MNLEESKDQKLLSVSFSKSQGDQKKGEARGVRGSAFECLRAFLRVDYSDLRIVIMESI